MSKQPTVIPSLDPITLEIAWNRLISIADEQAATLIRVSFSTVLSEAGDLSCGIFDPQGNMLVQANSGTPGHINTMATGVKHFLIKYPVDTLLPGDVLIGNDPWLFSGHKYDITVATPIFFKGRLIGLAANTCHAVDIGGSIWSAQTKEVYEEGLTIPLMKLFRDGQPNVDLFEIIRANVRLADQVIGDIRAQVAANDVASKKLIDFLKEFQFPDMDALSLAILTRSEENVREMIQAIPTGVYRHQVLMDGFDEPLRVSVAVMVGNGDLTVDFAGTSPQCDRAINVVLNYTRAYTTYALKTVIYPHVPNNEGSFRPIRIMAPEACLLNARFPAPVSARHIAGHFAPVAVLGALSQVIPEKVIADCPTPAAMVQMDGVTDRTGDKFSYVFFSAGGMGARPNQDGLSATHFPGNVFNTPVEIIESVSPLQLLNRELIRDSGGPGKYRGGCGQSQTIRVRSRHPATLSCMFDRIEHPPLGLHGGLAGRCGEVVINERVHPHPKKKCTLLPGDVVRIDLPGGGGFFSPLERDPERVLEDVVSDLLSAERAREDYAVVLDDSRTSVQMEATERARHAQKAQHATQRGSS